MSAPRVPSPLPLRDGVSASCVVLPSQGQGTMLDQLAQRLPGVAREVWCERMQTGEVVDVLGRPVPPQRVFEPGIRLFYYRALSAEPFLPFAETVLYQDEHLLVADKPHFMPVIPTGKYLHHTLLVRLKRRLGLEHLSPLHRIDRDTAGLVLFSIQPQTRAAYQSLFRDRSITKHYDAVAPWRPDLEFPRMHASRLQESPQFFRMHEVPGEPNSQTWMEIRQVADGWALYRLTPITGKRHQLRVHMAALGLPLRNDPYYPVVNDPPEGDYSRPLQLLAQSLHFTDPVTGQERMFCSRQQLLWP